MIKTTKRRTYSNVKRNCWAITEEGKQEMIQLCKICLVENEFSYISHLGKEKIKEFQKQSLLRLKRLCDRGERGRFSDSKASFSDTDIPFLKFYKKIQRGTRFCVSLYFYWW